MAIGLTEIVAHLDEYLRIDEVPDSGNALNGLQVEAEGPVRVLATAVDASATSIAGAAEVGADLLLVHHGLFWDGNRPVTGRRYRRLSALMGEGMALYSAHLPLDVHPEVGNNAILARELGIEVDGGFGEYKGMEVGLHGRLELSRDALSARLDDLLGRRVRMIAGGPERVRRVGVLTGGGGSYVAAALDAGLDALVTGEGSHHTYFDATEGHLNLYYGGHYATETWGVRELGERLATRYDLEVHFLDFPTGL